jgi:hypothetical protein
MSVPAQAECREPHVSGSASMAAVTTGEARSRTGGGRRYAPTSTGPSGRIGAGELVADILGERAPVLVAGLVGHRVQLAGANRPGWLS